MSGGNEGGNASDCRRARKRLVDRGERQATHPGKLQKGGIVGRQLELMGESDQRGRNRGAMEPSTHAEIAAVIRSDGAVVVRGGIPVDIARAAADVLLQCGAGGPRVIVDHYPDIVDAFAFGKIGDVCRAYLGPFVIPMMGLFVRRFDSIPEPKKVLPFHQDAYASPGGFDQLTCWTLLHPECNESCTRLELIRGASVEYLPKEESPSHPMQGWLEASHQSIASLIAEHGTWSPDLRIGDVVMFHQFTPHRTRPLDGGRGRLSFEFRARNFVNAFGVEHSKAGRFGYLRPESGRLVHVPQSEQ